MDCLRIFHLKNSGNDGKKIHFYKILLIEKPIMRLGKRTMIFLFLAGAELASIAATAALVTRKANPPETQAPATQAPLPEFLFSGIQIVIPETAQTCTENDQCLAVDTHCGSCCKYKPLNARYETAFDTAMHAQCKTYHGGFCECYDLSTYPACIEGKCQLVKWPDEDETEK